MARRPDKAKLEDQLNSVIKKAKTAPTKNKKAVTGTAIHPLGSRMLLLAFLTVLFFFSIAYVQPEPTVITGPIAEITVHQGPAAQNQGLIDTSEPLSAIRAQPGFHCFAGCSFVRPTAPMSPSNNHGFKNI